MKKKGFTLIELLAVIVILAIIALIATPIVMNVIENAGKGAAERSAENYVRTVETAIAEKRMDGPITDGEYVVQADGSLCLSSGCADETKLDVQVSGDKPEVGGTILIENGQIVDKLTGDESKTTTITIKGETFNRNEEGKLEVVKKNEEGENTSKVVYRHSEEEIKINDIINPADYTTDSKTLNKNVFLKHELDENNKVIASYACALFGGKEVCARGGSEDFYGYSENPENYTGNVLYLFNKNIGCEIGTEITSCEVSPVALNVTFEGMSYSYNTDDECCRVFYDDGTAWCSIW